MLSIELDYYDVPLYIEYEYDPGEDMVMYYPDGSGHPGSASNVEILDIYVNETSIIDILCYDTIETLETRILENEHS